MLEWFHSFCESNNLRYYAIDGTMLGTIRHQGFIPWDDDIDVGMPRKDYNRLIKLMNVNKGRFILEEPNSPAKDYRYPIAKIYDTTTTLVEDMSVYCKRGIFIDIFPLDGIGDNLTESKKNFQKIYLLSMILATRNSTPRSIRAWYKNAAIYISRLIPETVINTKRLAQRLNHLCSEHDYDQNNYVASLLSTYGSREIMKREVYGQPTLYKFENIMIYGVEHYEPYLSQLYGNWQELPPIEKRGVQHDFITLDLSQSYLNSLE